MSTLCFLRSELLPEYACWDVLPFALAFQLFINEFDYTISILEEKSMNPLHEHQAMLTRRQLFGRSVLGLGTAALATLLHQDGRADEPRRVGGLPSLPHFAPKAKRVIYLLQNGAPTHVDLYDYKPMLA